LPEAPGGSAVENSFEGVSEFKGSSVVSRAWTILWTKPAVFLGLTFVLECIGEAWESTMTYMDGNPGMGLIVESMVILFYPVLFLFFQGISTYAVFQFVMEDRISIRESIGRAFSRAWALCLIGVVFSFGMIAGMLPVAIPWMIFGSFFGTVVGAILVLPIAGFIICAWYVVVPVCVVERAGAFGSFGRSRVLTSGHRWKIFGMMLPVLIVMGIIYGVANFIVSRVAGDGFAARLIMDIVDVVPTAFVNIMSAIAYYSLRAAKESLTATSLAEVFN
jgi:hypothetical protein